MGKILGIKKFKTPMEVVILALGVIVICTAVVIFAPGVIGMQSVVGEELALDKEVIDNMSPEDLIALPSAIPSLSATKNPEVTIAGYAWNGETGIIMANGGPKTTKGSLMEANGINLNIVRQDWLSELAAMQMKFIEEYDAGKEFPSSDRSAFAVMIMGDGAAYHISTMQSALNEKYPNGQVDKNGKSIGSKYHVRVIGCMGMSNGEDKLIGPRVWKTKPETMLGSLISTVPGDGDWVTTLNYCFANNLKVNPDFTTYDADAVNFFPSEDDDYINSAKELIKSQNAGFTVKLNVVVDGKATGETIDKKIDGCATWTPGDKMVFDALSGFTDVASTKDFPNQMATTIIAVDEWAMEHKTIVTGILKATLTATNQIKQYDSWAVAGGEAVARTFNAEDGKYWYDMFKGQTGSKGGVSYSMGGTRVLNYADVMQYYGLAGDKKNRYRAVYDQVSKYLTTLNPFDFNSNVSGVVPYDDAVNMYFLKNMQGMVSAEAETVDYSQTKSNVLAQGQWKINFAVGSAKILSSSNDDIESIYNLLVQAEQTKIKIIGHTDNTGNAGSNMSLSDLRANSVAEALLAKGISVDRFQVVAGKGQTAPISDNGTEFGRAQNRRVEIVFLQ